MFKSGEVEAGLLLLFCLGVPSRVMNTDNINQAIMPGSDLSPMTIPGVTSTVVVKYFASLDAGDFTTTSQLFALDGALHPPFESMMIGRETIAAYLASEARGMKFLPEQGVAYAADQGCTELQITGKVQAPWFTVKVSWFFALSPQQEIFLVRINLITSPQELLQLRKFQPLSFGRS
jgi:Nuclear transport factor 2 (NTF2) domain